ncbi:MAG: ribonuclease P protein component [Nitrospinae bacterium]|nr:ribonuclease P protein component [Nitrospinota bacterium]
MTSADDHQPSDPGNRSGEPGDQSPARDADGNEKESGETSPSLRFTREDRLRSGKEFDRVFRGGRRRKGELLEFIWKRSEGGRTRLGLVVSRKSGGAVKRNRIKRLAREVFRRNRHRFPFPVDLVVRAYPRKEPIPDFPGVEKDFLDLADMLTSERMKGLPARSSAHRPTHDRRSGR